MKLGSVILGARQTMNGDDLPDRWESVSSDDLMIEKWRGVRRHEEPSTKGEIYGELRSVLEHWQIAVCDGRSRP
jgi:hypothetical protein